MSYADDLFTEAIEFHGYKTAAQLADEFEREDKARLAYWESEWHQEYVNLEMQTND